jgi:hypothetical protein
LIHDSRLVQINLSWFKNFDFADMQIHPELVGSTDEA